MLGTQVLPELLKGNAGRYCTENLQYGQVIDGLQIENPFLHQATGL